ncbi:hypothetical protein [Bradyrhizobium yuanmingense]|uniref:hypothetical protein n=1 Tax=Bradyrhizobium yuanmingense TaxID=108015 RepID=UPI0023BA3C51|nr:hypothetical protein [Bradyrhizobium yuanmingense]MDF0581646.1 hypothetical protein [Bradyrhizobium yuanmingense]
MIVRTCAGELASGDECDESERKHGDNLDVELERVSRFSHHANVRAATLRAHAVCLASATLKLLKTLVSKGFRARADKHLLLSKVLSIAPVASWLQQFRRSLL